MSPVHSRHSAAPALYDDAIIRIFLRIPPDEPASLVRACLVCKGWRRILTSPDFCRLYRELHRTPALLGFGLRSWAPDRGRYSRFIPTTAFRLSADLDFLPKNWTIVASRHGRILVGLPDDGGYIVWDPITDGRWVVPSPGIRRRSWAAAVLCAKENCDHLGCHGQPFLVAMAVCSHRTASACVYSSESGVWSDIIKLDHCRVDTDRSLAVTGSILVGNTLHFPYHNSCNVLQYKFREQKLSIIELPSKNVPGVDDVTYVLISAEDDVLVFARVDYGGTSLSLWSTKAGAVAWEWDKHTLIDLEKLLPPRAFDTMPYMCGFARGLVFLTTTAGLFTVELKSRRTKKVAEVERVYNVIPWICFYTPDRARLMMPQP